MKITARCPKNPDHKRFITVAHIAEDWLVDEHGNFLESMGDGEVTHEPNTGNTWNCAECRADATVKEE